MNEINEDGNAMPRPIRPAEAVKAAEAIEQSEKIVVKEKAKAWTKWTHVIGPFIRQCTDNAKRIAGGTRGPTYSTELKKQMGQFHPRFVKYSKQGQTAYLTKVMDNLTKVNLWLASIPEDERPTHPARVWQNYEREALRSSPQYAADAESGESGSAFADLEDSEDMNREKWKRRKTNQMSKDEIANKLNEVLYTLEQRELTGNARDDASNIWARSLSKHGDDERLAAAYLIDCCKELMAIVESVLGESTGKDA